MQEFQLMNKKIHDDELADKLPIVRSEQNKIE
jgi:hypothetical protein